MKNWQYFPVKKKPLLSKYQRWREVAKILKLSSRAKLRLEWLIFYHLKSNGNVSLVCRHFGIARKTFYKWFNVFNENNLRILEDESKAPVSKRQPRKYTHSVVDITAPSQYAWDNSSYQHKVKISRARSNGRPACHPATLLKNAYFKTIADISGSTVAAQPPTIDARLGVYVLITKESNHQYC